MHSLPQNPILIIQATQFHRNSTHKALQSRSKTLYNSITPIQISKATYYGGLAVESLKWQPLTAGKDVHKKKLCLRALLTFG